MNNKILVITGPTATGKTDLAIKLAQKFNGELVNADSRQVYQGMDIGTGKDLPSSSKFIVRSSQLNNKKLSVGYREKEGIPVWLVDVCKPDYVFNVGEYQKLARPVIADIQNRGLLPIVTGGTGLYIKSIIESQELMQIPPNPKLRQQLDKMTLKDLQDKLVKLDKLKFNSMNHSDQNNSRRLIRAIEIENWLEDCHSRYSLNINVNRDRNDNIFYSSSDPAYIKNTKIGGGVEKLTSENSPLPTGDNLLIGLTIEQEKLAKKIDERVEKRYQQGIIQEIQKLLDSGYNFDLPAMSGLGYREWEPFFKMSNDEFQMTNDKKLEILNLWKMHERQYAKRQMTFLKKMTGINWFNLSDNDYYMQIELKVGQWYNKLMTNEE